MNRIYKQILEAVQTLLTSLLTSDGWTVLLHDKPTFSQVHATLPLCLVAPPEDLSEEVVEQTFGNKVWLRFPVFVGTFVDDRGTLDADQLWKRTDARETIRLALWTPRVLGLESLGEFDVDYDPSGRGGEKAPAKIKGSWQRWDFKVETARAA